MWKAVVCFDWVQTIFVCVWTRGGGGSQLSAKQYLIFLSPGWETEQYMQPCLVSDCQLVSVVVVVAGGLFLVLTFTGEMKQNQHQALQIWSKYTRHNHEAHGSRSPSNNVAHGSRSCSNNVAHFSRSCSNNIAHFISNRSTSRVAQC